MHFPKSKIHKELGHCPDAGYPKMAKSSLEAVPKLPNLGVGNQPRFPIQWLKPYKNSGFPITSGSRLEPLGQGKTDFRDSLLQNGNTLAE